MLITWMVYATALAAMMAGGALALDRVAEIWNAPRRGVWIAVLILAVIAPVALTFGPSPVQTGMAVPPMNPSESLDGQMIMVRGTAHAAPMPLSLRERAAYVIERIPVRLSESWNRAAVAAWIAASTFLFALFLRGAWVVRRQRSRWREATLDGRTVVITDNVGPAVVGALRPRILLPAWVLSLGTSERELMLRHEAEHIRARDPLTLLVAALAIVVLPWNPALWFIVRRLRLAIEIDCDRRVLAQADSRAHEYGLLLLTVGARSERALQFTASLAEPRRFLERRILAMTGSRSTRPVLASLPFALIAVVAAAVAAQAPRPVQTLTAPVPVTVIPRPAEPIATPPVIRSTPPSVPASKAIAPPVVPTPPAVIPVKPVSQSSDFPSMAVIREWIQRYHPNVIAGDSGVNAVTIVSDTKNQYVASIADSTPAGAMTPMDSAIGRFALRMAVTEAALELATERLRAAAPREGQPLYVVDGVRVKNLDALTADVIQTIERLDPVSAASKYGPDAANGAVVVATRQLTSDADNPLSEWGIRRNGERLAKLGVRPDEVENVMVARVRAGIIGPNRLYITVLQVKGGGF